MSSMGTVGGCGDSQGDDVSSEGTPLLQGNTEGNNAEGKGDIFGSQGDLSCGASSLGDYEWEGQSTDSCDDKKSGCLSRFLTLSFWGWVNVLLIFLMIVTIVAIVGLLISRWQQQC